MDGGTQHFFLHEILPGFVSRMRASITNTLKVSERLPMSMPDEKSRQQIVKQLKNLQKDNFSNSEEILDYAKNLRNLSFTDVKRLNLIDYLPKEENKSSGNKGRFGQLLEKYFFGYMPNSDSQPDFPNAGMELKVSPIEYKKNRKKQIVIKAGERLVLTMIPYNKPLEDEFFESSLSKKALDILLINYLRDRSLENTEDQVIKLINRIRLSEDDLKIIQDDYRKIVQLIQHGRAHELSEGMTNYLGACTKGATAEKSLAPQYYPSINEKGEPEFFVAKRRAFSFKQSFMTTLVQKYEAEQIEADRIFNASEQPDVFSFEDAVIEKLRPYEGKDIKEIIATLGDNLKPNAKNVLNALTWRMLGSRHERIEEFEKAGIKLHTIRLQPDQTIKEHLKLQEVDFLEINQENDWENSRWFSLLSETRFFFVVFQKTEDGDCYLRGSFFWNMPTSDIGGLDSKHITGTAYSYWDHTKRVLENGVILKKTTGGITNNFINASHHRVCHLRPSADKAAYVFKDGTTLGNVEKDSAELPDGQRMTKQGFWLNKKYVEKIVEDSGI